MTIVANGRYSGDTLAGNRHIWQPFSAQHTTTRRAQQTRSMSKLFFNYGQLWSTVHGATEQRTTENVIKNYFPGLWFSVPRVRVEPRNSVNPLMGIVCVCSSVAVCWCRVRKPSVLLNCSYTLVTGHGLGSCRRDHWPVWEHFLRNRPSMQTYLYSIYFINIPRIIFVPFSSFFTATTGPIFIDKWCSDVDN